MQSLECGGLCRRPIRLSRADFARLPASAQIADVATLGAKRPGCAVRLAAILELLEPDVSVTHLGLHASRDNFHASIPLAAVQDRAVIIYADHGADLPIAAGGPFRFFVPDHAACQLAEVDECANVKFLDRLELTAGKGHDNRPQDEVAHAKLHDHAPPSS